VVKKKWCLECLVVALVLLFSGCGSDADGGAVNGAKTDPGHDSREVVETIDAPLFVYEILAERAAPDSSGIDILDLLSEPRVEQLLMNHIPEEVAVVQAKYEAAAAFGIDSAQFAMDSGAVVLAVAAMVQNRGSKDETLNFIRTLGEDLKGDGVWSDPNGKIKIADWIVGLDSNWRYNDIRNNAMAAYGGNVPNFEKYMRAFFPLAYSFVPCSAANAGQVTYVNQGQSAIFANDYESSDHSAVRFICDVNGFQWRIAQPMEKDTAGFGQGTYDREIREGRVIHDNYYIYDAGAWRLATPQEADGFTDLVEVYANLKADEKVIFVIRHSERTNDTGPNGHLTDNGVKYAKNLGKRLADAGKKGNFYYGYSGYTRTKETCENIAVGYGQAGYAVNVVPAMDGAWYVKDDAKASGYVDANGGWEVYSRYAFTGAYADAFYDLEDRSVQLIEGELVASLPQMERVNFMCTHDYLVVPLLAYVTDGHANVRFYEKWKWVNYLAGAAIIVSPDGSLRYIPVKGLETGVM
jgi:broad specificity phosphatase PhoE